MRRRGPQHVIGRPVPDASRDLQIVQDAQCALHDAGCGSVSPAVGDCDLEVVSAGRANRASVGPTERHPRIGEAAGIVDRQETLEERPIVGLLGEERGKFVCVGHGARG